MHVGLVSVDKYPWNNSSRDFTDSILEMYENTSLEFETRPRLLIRATTASIIGRENGLAFPKTDRVP